MSAKELDRGELHAFAACLSRHAESVAHYYQLLSAAERSRADSFRFPVHRTNFIVSHGLLRQILAKYLELAPEEFVFEYGPYGKPYIPGASIHFNMSHSADLAIYAVSLEPRVGVDVELVRPIDDHLALAACCFSKDEQRQLAEAAPATSLEAFYNCWTRKEAFVKAIGSGLTTRLDSFHVSLLPAHAPQVISIDGDRTKAAEWSLFDLHPAPGYVAAISIWGQGLRLRFEVIPSP
jgi:4'-phosphopantetheinyl transferase